MKKIYEKPKADLVEFTLKDRIMDVTDYSEGVGNEDAGGDYGDE